jgi:hypothetical protein
VQPAAGVGGEPAGRGTPRGRDPLANGALTMMEKATTGPELQRWLRRGRGTAVIVRPDGTVRRAGHEASVLCAPLPSFATKRTLTTAGGAVRAAKASWT